MQVGNLKEKAVIVKQNNEKSPLKMPETIPIKCDFITLSLY